MHFTACKTFILSLLAITCNLVQSTDWFYLNHGAGVPVRCSSTPNMLECAADDGVSCKWGTYETSWSSYQKMSGVTANNPHTTNCPGWPSSDGFDSCSVLGCYEGSDWFYLNHGAGVPVRCSSTPNMLECAADNGVNCKWGTYGTSWSSYQKISGVSAKYPRQQDCPGWPTSDGTDACRQLGCYTDSPTKHPTIDPTKATQSPTSTPTSSPTKDPTSGTKNPTKATQPPTLAPTQPTLSPTAETCDWAMTQQDWFFGVLQLTQIVPINKCITPKSNDVIASIKFVHVYDKEWHFHNYNTPAILTYFYPTSKNCDGDPRLFERDNIYNYEDRLERDQYPSSSSGGTTFDMMISGSSTGFTCASFFYAPKTYYNDDPESFYGGVQWFPESSPESYNPQWVLGIYGECVMVVEDKFWAIYTSCVTDATGKDTITWQWFNNADCTGYNSWVWDSKMYSPWHSFNDSDETEETEEIMYYQQITEGGVYMKMRHKESQIVYAEISAEGVTCFERERISDVAPYEPYHYYVEHDYDHDANGIIWSTFLAENVFISAICSLFVTSFCVIACYFIKRKDDSAFAKMKHQFVV